jgi:ribonuclease HII
LIDLELQVRVNALSLQSNGDSSYVERSLRRDGLHLIAGVDEAGRGPLAGPVVAAAVILPHDGAIAGITDSKKLSPKRRIELAEEIRRHALGIGVGVIDNTVIDTVNILRATIYAIKQAVSSLAITPELLLIDGNHLDCDGTRAVSIIKGDLLCRCIGAASIIAKVERDAIMTDLHRRYPAYGFDMHKGYPTRAHRQAIRQYGFSPVHRKTFHVG